MSKPVETIVRRFIAEVWNEGKPQAAASFVTEAYRDHAYPGGDLAALEKQVALANECFARAQHEIEDVVVDGDRVMMRGRLRGHHTGPFRGVAPTNASFDVRIARWFRLEGERIAEHWALLDTAGLLSQIQGKPHT